MSVIIYSRDNSELVSSLIKSIKDKDNSANIATGSSVKELLGIIKEKGTVNTFCILILKDMRDAMALVSRKELFWTMNLIMMVDIASEGRLSFAHELHPSYVGLIQDGIENVTNILMKMSNKN